MIKNNYSSKKYIATHTKQSEEDKAAVSFLTNVLSIGGFINPDFSYDDKWPNHDGFFEFVSNPDISRIPEQIFIVQIKGTSVVTEKDGVISYSLKSLSFPAFIANKVTADPGILFVVLKPCSRNEQRIFWKNMSISFLSKIDYTKSSTTIKFSLEDEIVNTDESIELFCEKIKSIVDTHLFLNKLDSSDLKEGDALDIIDFRAKEINKSINNLCNKVQCRDEVSKLIIRDLNDLCYATLILNAYKNEYKSVNEKLAWEVSQLSVDTRYLCNFLIGLKYINGRIPKEGQSERLMLKYYNYLWEIRRFMKNNYNISILDNLEEFPLDIDTVDSEYYEKVARQIEKINLKEKNVNISRYYVQKTTPFFVKGERYYEITLQLAGIYSTKYNRVTVYSKQTIATYYSIQIAYTNTEIEMWGIKNSVKILNNFKVAIDPSCLNTLAKILKNGKGTQINRNYREYINLMDFLTKTGMNLYELVNLGESKFSEIYDKIFPATNTHEFGEILKLIRRDYSRLSNNKGKNTIGFVMLHMRDEILKNLIPNQFFNKCLSETLYISKRCCPFENNPLVANLVGTKSSKKERESIIELLGDSKKISLVQPYIAIDNMISETGELLFDKFKIGSDDEINRYNDSLDSWEKDHGYSIIEKDGLVSIASYYNTTIKILNYFMRAKHSLNSAQQKSKDNFLKNCRINFDDITKKIALKNIFLNSNIMLIYGAAGTGKTRLIEYISMMFKDSSKLYLTKTHTALQNIKRHLRNNDTLQENCYFEVIDSITKGDSNVKQDIVFVDECSTIDNRTMSLLLEKLKDDTFLVMSGDIHQIESIDFGNWFFYAKEIVIAKGASIELGETWRTQKEELKNLWNAVRKKDVIITEILSMDGPFSENLGEDIFHLDGDEVVLCLNYDGKFGLNNMNQYFQSINNSKAYTWEEWTYKVGDRILFTNSNRSNLLYNNLKGIITNIEYGENKIKFEIEVNENYTEYQCEKEPFNYIKNTVNGTVIELDVITWDDDLKEAEKVMTVIPFQLAYAISIHKAQGLEYKSVKVIIPSNNAEMISHSIFYTAITRAKDKLKIFWSAETMKSIIESFSNNDNEHRTLTILRKDLDPKSTPYF